MKDLKKLSANELSELIEMYERMQRVLEIDFMHVSGNCPAKLLHDFKAAQVAALAEYERRYMD